MLKHILVAHDLSAQADLALQRAAHLAQRQQARLSLVHVLSADGDEACARQRLQAALAACAATEATLHLPRGNPRVEIAALLHWLEADLLVAGCHHRDSPQGFAGTTLEQLLQHCNTPILLAAAPVCPAWHCALVPLDFSPCASRALQFAARLLDEDARLLAVHVHEVARVHAGDDPAGLAFQRSLFEGLLEEEGAALPAGVPPLQGVWLAGERDQCLERLIAAEHPQLLALGGHSRGVLADALLGSLAQQMLQQAPCDVLVVR